ncbi:MAG: hypothetical protein M3007_06295 [Candidatus Eremiobacteraeota bacterium]|nr:hypothetical protein [Candidatus Eremiobacteraeota bacterium]
MQRPTQKRQIIKTRSQRPYIIARIVIVLAIIIALISLVLAFEHQAHGRHAQAGYGRAALAAGASFLRPEVERDFSL